MRRRINRHALLTLIAIAAGVVSTGCQSGTRGLTARVSCNNCTTADVQKPYTVPSYDGNRTVGYLTNEGKACACAQAAGAVVDTTPGQPCAGCHGTMTPPPVAIRVK